MRIRGCLSLTIVKIVQLLSSGGIAGSCETIDGRQGIGWRQANML
jgi:hypothetical protein